MFKERRFGTIITITAIIVVLLITEGNTSARGFTLKEEAKEVAEAIDYKNPVTRNYAVKLASEYPGEYNVGQICSVYEHIRYNWKYVSDPSGRDYYASASETIGNGLAGDCDDFAILMAAAIEAIGGSSRIIAASGPKGNHV
jgi:transglutaminase-like putative cysteine protease